MCARWGWGPPLGVVAALGRHAPVAAQRVLGGQPAVVGRGEGGGGGGQGGQQHRHQHRGGGGHHAGHCSLANTTINISSPQH